MGVDVFNINLDNPAKQYVSGQTLSGKVLLSVSGEETTTAVMISFCGTAHTHWSEEDVWSPDGGLVSRYDGNELLFELTLKLFGDGKNRTQIPTGNNVFPFKFQVPSRPLPVACSFENGSVFFGLEARILKPWYKVDPLTEILPVTLLPVVDLTMTPGAANSMQVEDSKRFGSFSCCPGQPCSIKSFTPKTGFIPGEVVPCIIEINNQSDHSIISMTATLTQFWTFFAYGRLGKHYLTHQVALQKASHGRMGPKEVTTWEVAFTIPSTVPPSPKTAASEIVEMEYVIWVCATVKECCAPSDLEISHPIVIGTVPLAPIASATQTNVKRI